MQTRHQRYGNSTTTPFNTIGTILQSFCWASLNEDVIRLIAQRVLSRDFVDYIYFCAVCKLWRSNTSCPRGRSIMDPSFHPRNWMMFPEGHGPYPGNIKLKRYVRFVNLSTGAFASPSLPIFGDHCALDSVNGLLLLQRDHDTAIRLLHPFTGDMVDLPPLTTLLPQIDMFDDDSKFVHLRAICASVSINDATGAINVMFALRKLGKLVVAVATSGDHHWRLFEWNGLLTYCPPLSFQGNLYVMARQTNSFGVQLLQIGQPEKVSPTSMKLVATSLLGNLDLPLCLAECDGDILVLCYSDQSLTPLTIYKLADLMMKRFVPMTSIGDNSLFIDERSLCVSTKASSTIVGNNVIFFHPIERCLAKYCLNSGSTTLDEGGILDPKNYPRFYGPCSFIHHIFTCCRHAFW